MLASVYSGILQGTFAIFTILTISLNTGNYRNVQDKFWILWRNILSQIRNWQMLIFYYWNTWSSILRCTICAFAYAFDFLSPLVLEIYPPLSLGFLSLSLSLSLSLICHKCLKISWYTMRVQCHNEKRSINTKVVHTTTIRAAAAAVNMHSLNLRHVTNAE